MVVQQEVVVPGQHPQLGAAAGGDGAAGGDRACAEASGRETTARLGEVEPMVRAICRGRLGDVDGDDAAQQTMLTVWRALDSGREIESLPAYAATCARYQVLSTYRDFARRATPCGHLSEALWAEDGPGPAEQVVRVDEVAHAKERVAALLAQLSPRQAEVMRASVLAERSTAAAAAALGITPTGLRTAQVRAMARLRELCGTQSPNPRAGRATASRHDGDAMPDPTVRAHAVVDDAVTAATSSSEGVEDGDAATARGWSPGCGTEYAMASTDGDGVTHPDHDGDADVAGAA